MAGLSIADAAGGGVAALIANRGVMLPSSDAAAHGGAGEAPRIFAVQRRLPDAALYHVNVAVQLDVDLDPQLLVDALNEIADRHPVLAARVVASQPPSMAARAEPIEIDFFDLSRLDPVDALDTARDLSRRLRRTPFDLEAEPPVRVWLEARIG